MGVREVNRLLEQWKMNARNLPLWMILALTPRKRERWHALWLLDQGWTTSATADAWERDPHTIGRWAAALDEGGPTALMFEQTGGSPRRNAAGSVEGGGSGVARLLRYRTGQLELESGLSVRL